MPELGDLVAESSSFTDVVKYDPPIIPWLLEYETTLAAKAFVEVLQGIRIFFASSEEKLALLDEAQKALDEYLNSRGLITYKTKVVTAKKVAM